MMSPVARHFGLAADPFQADDTAGAPETMLQPGAARDFIDARIARVGGGPGLFAPAAADEVARAAAGDPRRLRWLAGLAMLEASLDGASVVEPRHAAAAAARALSAAPVAPAAPVPAALTPAALPIAPPRTTGPRWAFTPARAALGVATLAAFVLTVAVVSPVGLKLVAPVQTIDLPARDAPPRQRPARPRLADRDRGPTLAATPYDETSSRDARPDDARPADARVGTAPPGGTDTIPVAAPPAVVRAASAPRAAPQPPPVLVDATPDTVPAAPLDSATDATPVSEARVFIHHLPEDRDAAEDLADLLAERGWRIADLRAVGAAVRAANARYYHRSDALAAATLAGDLAEETGAPAATRNMRGFARPPRPGTLEIWLPPGG